ncbi:uncharacterized protein LOC113359355 [Papaver somniferum]|uniref:uncharacterized protein LOC113359355 n=1 Tax=Papaver somniferum TaxID=3469 RepID=UPI000E6FB452|nr:uncharacterized protein LOC113359355 [Papaver somniferum]
MRSFKFFVVLRLMYKIIGITEILCQGLQKKTQDTVIVMSLVSTTKELLRELREEGWKYFITTVVDFCIPHDVHIPDMEAHYIMGTGRFCQHRDNITEDHHYRVDTFNVKIDCQLLDLDLCLCNLAEKLYPLDFCQQEVHILRNELQHYGQDVLSHLSFQILSIVSELRRKLVVTKKQVRKIFFNDEIVKTAARNKIEEDFLRDCMKIYIEQVIA